MWSFYFQKAQKKDEDAHGPLKRKRQTKKRQVQTDEAELEEEEDEALVSVSFCGTCEISEINP